MDEKEMKPTNYLICEAGIVIDWLGCQKSQTTLYKVRFIKIAWLLIRYAPIDLRCYALKVNYLLVRFFFVCAYYTPVRTVYLFCLAFVTQKRQFSMFSE